MSKINITTCGECPLFDAENRGCLIDPEGVGCPYSADQTVRGDEDGAFCAHVRNKIIRRCHEWMKEQEEGK